MLGIPKEPYGFSGTGRNLAGPATWEQAKIQPSGRRRRGDHPLSD